MTNYFTVYIEKSSKPKKDGRTNIMLLISNVRKEKKRLTLPGIVVKPNDFNSIAQSPIFNTTITVRFLTKKGYESMLDWYQKVISYRFIPTLFS